MHNYRFAISCFAISAAALGTLTVSATDFWADFLYVLADYSFGMITFIVLFLAVQFFARALHHIYKQRGNGQQSNGDWYMAYAKSFPVLDVVSATLGLMITITSFTTYKTTVVGAGGYGFDAAFIAWDRAIFGGYDAWEWTHSVVSSAQVTRWIDFLYHAAFFPMVIGFILCISARSHKALRQTYMLSYIGSFFLIGMLMAAALHSGGPVFDGVVFGDGSTFAPLMERQAAQLAAGGGPQTASVLINYLSTLHQSDEARIGAGISAMPSMHIVMVLLWLFPMWHLNRVLGLVFVVYTGVIWFGSVHLGWHYFVDGLVSLFVVAIIWRVCGHITGLSGRRIQLLRATT
jgi:hypothetical protein